VASLRDDDVTAAEYVKAMQSLAMKNTRLRAELAEATGLRGEVAEGRTLIRDMHSELISDADDLTQLRDRCAIYLLRHTETP
jgi:hypothetical protein